jgi:nucleotide-binding universal stress UspA family protein
MGRIVVGVDGSAIADAALRWAVDEARLRGARLDVVHAVWTYPAMATLPAGMAPPHDFEAQMVAGAEEELREVLARVGVDGVEVDARVVRGAAAPVLVEAAEGADLLVVGSRGRGGFAGLLLGSVSQRVAQLAPCPVVIVHGPRA